ncbi:MAG: amino acid ABC transporter substrate-binding protein [Herpetosiphon sp.]
MLHKRMVGRTLWAGLISMLALLLAACGGGLAPQTGNAGAGAASTAAGAPTVSAGGAAKTSGATAAAGATSTTGAAGTSASDGSELVIGASLPLTGKEGRVGNFYKEGYETAVKQYNDKGGVKVGNQQRRVKLIVLDNQTSPTTSSSQYERLVTQEKVDFLLGSYSSPLVSADSVVAQRYKIPYVNGGGAASDIYSKGNKYLFGALSSVENLAKAQMDWLKTMQDTGKLTAKPAKIALIWENTDHGKDFQKGIQDYTKANPDRFQVVIDEGFELGGQDYTSLLTKVKSANADLFMADAHLEDFILMQRQYREQGLHHQMVTYGARGTEKDARDQLGKDGVSGIVSATWWTSDLPYPEVKEFINYYKSTHKDAVPQWYQALGYETAHILLNSIEIAGTADREKVRDTLAAYNQPSILPGHKTYFKPNGQIDNPFVVVQNNPEGKSIVIYPADVKTGDAIMPLPKK